MYDTDREVATEAIRSAGRLGAGDFLFVPPLVALLRHRLLKSAARDVLVGYGENVLDTLAYFLRDQEEDIWTRRHIPGTLARIPSQKTMDILVDALGERDGFLRYKVVSAIGRLRRSHPELTVPVAKVQPLIVQETNRYFVYLSLRYNLERLDKTAPQTLLGHALTEKLGRTEDRVYRLLGLIYPWKDISAARWSLAHGEARTKASAAEYLDNILDSTLRKHVMPLIEELPPEEKVKRGNALLKTRIRDAEDSLAQLIHDEDQVVAAAAVQLVEQRGLWSLTDDLEYALEHRDVKDWYVFEAASWALAAKNMTPEQRAARWLEPLPAVEIADRLRKLPVFRFTSVDELFRIAGTGRQVRRESGRVLYEAGQRASDLEFLLDGSVTLAESNGATSTLEAPAALGFEEVFENVPQRATTKASGIAICLSLLNEQFLGLLSENTDLAQGIFRQLLEMRGDKAQLVVTGVVRPPQSARFKDGLEPIEKALLLEEMPVFSRATSEQISQLAAITQEVKMTESELLFREGDTPAIYILLEGELSLEPVAGGQPAFARAGDSVAVYETLGGEESTGWKAHVTRGGLALRVEREALFDLLADHIDLLQGLFSALQRRQQAAVATT
jgi:CRP-like cAMP-binding protein